MQACGWRRSKCTQAEAECLILDRIQHTKVTFSQAVRNPAYDPAYNQGQSGTTKAENWWQWWWHQGKPRRRPRRRQFAIRRTTYQSRVRKWFHEMCIYKFLSKQSEWRCSSDGGRQGVPCPCSWHWKSVPWRSLHCDYGLHMTQRPTHGIRLLCCTAAAPTRNEQIATDCVVGTVAFSNCDTENYGIA